MRIFKSLKKSTRKTESPCSQKEKLSSFNYPVLKVKNSMSKKNTAKASNVKVIKDELKPETPEILAKAIIQISEAFESFLNSNLTRRALITLLLDLPEIRSSKVGRSDIELVLNNLPKLKGYYVKK